VALENSSAKLCRPGSVAVVVRSGILAHTLPVATLQLCAAINQDIKCFDCGNNELNGWLALALKSSAREILTLNREGTTVQSVKYDTLKDFELRVPPLIEQARITAKIEDLFNHVNSCREHLAKIPKILKAFRQSVLAAACSGGLTEDWRLEQHQLETGNAVLERALAVRRRILTEQSARIAPPLWSDNDVAPDIPDNWCWATLDAVASVIDPNPSHRMPKYVDKGIAFISSENFVNGDRIDFSVGKAVSKDTLREQRLRFSIRDGDFALSRIGTIGKTRFLPVDRDYCLSHALVVIQSFSDEIDRRFLRWLLSSRELVTQAKEGVQSGGVPDLGMGKIRAFRIPIMSHEEQIEIVRRVEILFKLADKIEQRVDAATKRADKLTQAILAKAFRGELVPTEAELARQEGRDYEPASVLLERIKSERARLYVSNNGAGRRSVKSARK
jgi:type I restriction enzyme S subunit